MNYPDTYYSRTIVDRTERPALSGPAECDTVVIGGGLAGLTTALQLARGGQKVVVLEAQSIGFGASGRNGGFVSAGFATDVEHIARIGGAERAHQLYLMSIEGVEFVRETIAALGIAGADPIDGVTSVMRYDDGAGLKAYAAEARKKYGQELTYLDTASVRQSLRSTRYFHGVRDGKAFHIHPLNYLRGIAAEIERLGGVICENSRALSTDLAGAKKQVRTENGAVTARSVVFSTGGYTDHLNPQLRRAMLPIATYVMVSEEAPDLIASAITTRDGIGDNRRAGDYYRLVDDGRRLLWGGRITTRAASTAGLVQELRREMTGTYPQLRDLKTELAWSGLMAYARHLMPQIGEMQPGVWHCTAFGGHGLNTTAIGGKVVAEAILKQSDRHTLFAPFGLAWAGGIAGLTVAQLTYWKLQAQDWWRERAA
ncbi:NAD(P)/FAD-dependent oxidoreductase [Rhizobium wuzhouense]|uniref:FAD-dependent oxidoreductase n=1 Tax=Rhizobium wuzhouense TaxID=1986026 RepID=A0ABX5NYJ7_9HYPH|nr:FAD-binding oxidoreductase [Rhizobium wuzhouense]PYB77434.1 FAD-dependent oxidoreductase [Rhizobium wuzhouense]